MTGPFPYAVADIDQWQEDGHDDMVPGAANARELHARVLATDATIFGLPSVYQYAQMYRQAVDAGDSLYTGFNRFSHQRDLADPDFEVFRTPNVDTLYSNAWLDLTGGPALVTIPAMGPRYYTLQFCDAHANATNLSSRTVGPDGGTFLIAPPGWGGAVPGGAAVFRVASPYMWILMRIAIGDDELAHVRGLQDDTVIRGASGGREVDFPPCSPESVESDWQVFFSVLDFVLRHHGSPKEEHGLVQRFRTIGLGGGTAREAAVFDEAIRCGLEAGFRDAMSIIESSRGDFGQIVGTGWMTGTAGDNGFNYLRRAVQNFVGTGGNVSQEKRFFVTWIDADGRQLDGSKGTYTLHFPTPPPVAGHWSLTLYDAETRMLIPNPINRYAISPWTPGLETNADGSLTVTISHDDPNSSNWLPAPSGPFYLDIRAWEPTQPVQDGRWVPEPVLRVQPS